MKRTLRVAFLAAAIAATALAARAMFMNNSVKVPVDRVVTNVEAWIKDKPKDAQGYYVLGRIHAMAWAYGPDLNLWGAAGGRGGAGGAQPADDPFKGQLPGFAPYDSVQVRPNDAKKQLTAEDAKHLEQSITAYKKAVELDPTKGIYELGLAWILQETGTVVAGLPAGFLDTTAAKPSADETTTYQATIKKLGDADGKVRDEASKTLAAALPKSYESLRTAKSDDAETNSRIQSLLKTYWDLQALEQFRKAYSLNLTQDLANGGDIVADSADSQIAAEAGDSIVAILKSQPQAAKPNEAQEVAANVQKIRSKPHPVTPIVFAIPGSPQPDAVSDLVNPAARVNFDLAGDGIARQWPWLKPGTALLVWDPANTGQITSGRALFGSRTWWIFFRDGYEALSVLDDNRDGQLTNSELDGIKVWIDANGNGISEPGEVKTLASLGIDAIATTSTRDAHGTLISSAGIHFTNGRSVQSFDWVTSPIIETNVTAAQP